MGFAKLAVHEFSCFASKHAIAICQVVALILICRLSSI